MKHLTIVFAITAIPILFAEPTASIWQPKFNDKPVSEALKNEVLAALPDKAIVTPQAQRTILIYSATAGYRHGSIPVGKLALEELGLKTSAYQAIISDDLANFENDKIHKFDAIVLLNSSGDFFMPSGKKKKTFSDEEWKFITERHHRLLENLQAYVEQGGGLVGIHAATDACKNHDHYPSLIGGVFDGHPWTAGKNANIVVEDPQHAINQPVFGDMKDFMIKEEIYQLKNEPYSRDKLRILLHLNPEKSDPVDQKKVKRTDNDFAVSWVQSVGKGRVFYTNFGHNHEIFSNPLILKHYLAGIQFATGDLAADTTPSNAIKK